MRTGTYIKQIEGYRAFVPATLPPVPPIDFDSELIQLLSAADQALGRLDGVGAVLPNPDLFVSMYVRQEAVLSSQIEGTQSTLKDVLEFEVNVNGDIHPRDIEEVVNYVKALNYGLRRLDSLPLSLRLIREIHQQLLTGVRGSERTPGEFRRSQNWIGPPGSTLNAATFVPPPVHEMNSALDNLEKFLHQTESFPSLIHCALVHSQFETIHPFLDGNGRVGRLLITFQLCQRGVLQRPLLYLSHYFKAHRTEYYDRLMAVRLDGNWEAWIKFFLKGIATVSESAISLASSILALRERNKKEINEKMGNRAAGAIQLLDVLFEQPIITTGFVKSKLNYSQTTVNKLIDEMTQMNILNEETGGKRNRRFRYAPYLDLFNALDTSRPS
ncbi:MAG: Fic family protein [Planctomycetaceae bacterium]